MQWPTIYARKSESEDPSVVVKSTLRLSEVLALVEYCEEKNEAREGTLAVRYTNAGVVRASVRFAMEHIDDFQAWMDERDD